MRRITFLVGSACLLAAIAGPADAATLTLRWSGLSTPVSPGHYATATIITTMGASCGIVVKYSTATSRAAGLVTKKAPSGGRLSWRWKVGTNTHPGSWRVTITCRLATKSLVIWRTMAVR